MIARVVVVALLLAVAIQHAAALDRRLLKHRRQVSEPVEYRSGASNTLNLRPGPTPGSLAPGRYVIAGAVPPEGDVMAQMGGQGTKLDLLAKVNLATKVADGYPLNRNIYVTKKPNSQEPARVWIRSPSNASDPALAPGLYEVAARAFLDQFDYWGNVYVRNSPNDPVLATPLGPIMTKQVFTNYEGLVAAFNPGLEALQALANKLKTGLTGSTSAAAVDLINRMSTAAKDTYAAMQRWHKQGMVVRDLPAPNLPQYNPFDDAFRASLWRNLSLPANTPGLSSANAPATPGATRSLSADTAKLLDDGFKEGNKAIQDQLNKIYEKFAADDKADALAVGTPVPMWELMNEQRKKDFMASAAAAKIPETFLAAVKSNEFVLDADRWVSKQKKQIDDWGKDVGDWFSGLFSHGKKQKQAIETEANKALAPGEAKLAEAALNNAMVPVAEAQAKKVKDIAEKQKNLVKVGYSISPSPDIDYGKLLKGKFDEALKSFKINQKLKITSGPNVHTVELNVKVSDPLKSDAKLEAELKWKSELKNGLSFGAGTKTTVEGIRKDGGPDKATAVVNAFVTYNKGSTQTGLFVSVEVPMAKNPSGAWEQTTYSASINAYYRTVLPNKAALSINADANFTPSTNTVRLSAAYTRTFDNGLNLKADASVYGNNLGLQNQELGVNGRLGLETRDRNAYFGLQGGYSTQTGGQIGVFGVIRF